MWKAIYVNGGRGEIIEKNVPLSYRRSGFLEDYRVKV
jgi:hypothetical protein